VLEELATDCESVSVSQLITEPAGKAETATDGLEPVLDAEFQEASIVVGGQPVANHGAAEQAGARLYVATKIELHMCKLIHALSLSRGAKRRHQQSIDR
jgi:hypothetical protein